MLAVSLSHEAGVKAAASRFRDLPPATEKVLREPDLETLQQIPRCGTERSRAAAHLHVHPNTVDDRLCRIVAAAGANPRTAR